MSRVSGCLWLAVGLVLALIAGGVAYVTVQRAALASPAPAAVTATTPVVVAARAVPLGTLLAEADLSLQTFPTANLPAGVLKTVAEAAGQLTTVSLGAGEFVLSHHLVPADIKGTNLSFALPQGLVAVSLAAEDLLSRVQGVQTGDHVDLMYSLKVAVAENGSQYTFGLLQNIIVVHVVRGVVSEAGVDKASTAPAQAYLLALDPQDALVLKYVRDAGGVMDLGLRNITDDTDHRTQPVDAQYLMDKFQLPER